jgi:hypothetical protein
MNTRQSDTPEASQPRRYAIRIRGHLDQRWADWFDGLSLTHDSDGTTLLAGPLADQAALHGVLNKLRDLGLPIISMQSNGPED